MPELQFNYTGRQVELSADFISTKNELRDGKIYVINTSTGAVGNIEVTVTIPVGLTLVLASAVPSVGTFDDGTLIWTLPGIAGLGEENMDLTLEISDDCYTDDIQVEYTAVVLAGGDDISNNTGYSKLCGIACCEVKPCIDVNDYLTFGLNIVTGPGTGRYGDPLTIDVAPGGPGTTIYSSLLPPQLFNPDGPGVTGNTDDFTLVSANPVAFVTHNGQVLDDSEYSLVGSVLTVAPSNGYDDTNDEILVFQHTFATLAAGGVVNNFIQKNVLYTVLTTDYYVECTANTFAVTLPTAVGVAGQSYVVKNSGAGIITVDCFGAETIDGGLTATLNQYDSITVVSNGTNWIIV